MLAVVYDEDSSEELVFKDVPIYNRSAATPLKKSKEPVRYAAKLSCNKTESIGRQAEESTESIQDFTTDAVDVTDPSVVVSQKPALTSAPSTVRPKVAKNIQAHAATAALTNELKTLEQQGNLTGLAERLEKLDDIFGKDILVNSLKSAAKDYGTKMEKVQELIASKKDFGFSGLDQSELAETLEQLKIVTGLLAKMKELGELLTDEDIHDEDLFDEVNTIDDKFTELVTSQPDRDEVQSTTVTVSNS